MPQFDIFCGLTEKEIGMIKFAIKKEMAAQLPEMPEHVEKKLLLEGSDTWVYSWYLLEWNTSLAPYWVTVEVKAKLKPEFHSYSFYRRYMFLCKLQLTAEGYSPIVEMQERSIYP